MEEIKRYVLNYVNSKVNRFSKISKVVDNEGEFEKTPTKKIRRFIYNRKGKDQETQKNS
jgi:long-chain acyl-CoA synthetase